MRGYHFVNGESVAGIESFTGPDNAFKLFPNPTNGNTILTINTDVPKEVLIAIIDYTGKTLERKSYSGILGPTSLPINSAHLSSGVYLIQILVGNDVSTKTLVVE